MAECRECVVREAVEKDFTDIAGIYAWHVLHGSASFEIEPPEQGVLIERWRKVCGEGLPWLVAEADGGVEGYAYGARYRPRPAYRFTVENSVYVRPGRMRMGTGRLLMATLVERCTDLGYRQMIAVIGDSGNRASISFHETLGFRHAGTLTSIGYKFDRWVDSVLMVLPLGEGDRSPPRV